jgi:hypothetical protein
MKSLKKIIFIFLLFSVIKSMIAQNDDDFNDVYLLDNNNNPHSKFRNGKNAVCQITSDLKGSGTGVLVNNSKNDGKMYLLTAAHMLPGAPQLTLDIGAMNTRLANYTFDFTYQTFVSSIDNAILLEPSTILTGAKIAALYFKEIDLSTNSNLYILPTDLVLLELLQKPTLSPDLQIYYAGWNFDYEWEGDDDQVLIHHPSLFTKKVSMPKEEAAINAWINKDQLGEYSLRYSGESEDWEPGPGVHEPLPPALIMHKNTMGDHFGWSDMYGDYTWGIPIAGSSGAPFFNQNELDIEVYAIYTSQRNESNNENFSIGVKLTKDMYENNPNFNVTNPNNPQEYRSLNYFLGPGDPVKGGYSLSGGYPCATGVTGIPLNEQNLYRKTMVIDEEISGTTVGSFVAQDEIQISSLVRPGARVSFAAEQVLLGIGTDFQPDSEVEITSGGKNGMDCATGCYSIKNRGYTIENGSVYGSVENAESVEVSILVNGIDVTPGKQEVNGDTVWLFNIVDASIETPRIYEVRAIYKSGCDELIVNYEVEIKLEDLDNVQADYYAYANAVLPEANYINQKNALGIDYQPDAEYNPQLTTNQAEDVLFEVNVARNIPFAKAWGVSSEFLDGSLVTCTFSKDGKNCFNSAIMETQAEALNHLYQNSLQMDVYFPKMREGTFMESAKALPLIIYAFGGAFSSHPNPSNGLSDTTCRWLASRGYVVASIDYRVGLNLNKTLGPRAAIRAHQDLLAAIRYWELKPKSDIIYQAVDRKWSIDTNKIYGLGWSSGGITVLNNIYLTDAIYQQERQSGGLLFGTTGEHIVTLDACPNDDPIEGCGLPLQGNTYDLENYPSQPCIGSITNPCASLYTNSLKDVKLRKGISFAGAIPKLEWMQGNTTPVLDIHHKDDKVVSFETAVPFGHLASLANSLGLVGLNAINGGGAMESYLSDNSAIADFQLLELDAKNQAGGKSLLSSHHYPQLKFGDKWSKTKDNPRVEPKIMYHVDAFFSKEETPNNNRSANNLKPNVHQEDVLSTDLLLYPNPSKDGTFYLEFGLHHAGSARVEIVSLAGQLIYQKQNQYLGKGKHKLQFGKSDINLVTGFYVVKVITNEFSGSRKLIVE